MTQCHISIISDEHIQGTRQARHDWADVTGQEMELKPSVFVDKRTGWKYCHITGAIAYPGIEPGCLIVCGVQHEPEVKFIILEYQEHQSVYELIQAVVNVRSQYAYGQHEGILSAWIGDQNRYLTLISKCSQVLEKQDGHDRGLYIREPTDWREKYAFPMYVRQLHSALAEKKLMLNGHIDLINRLQAFQPVDADKGKLTDFPSVGILGAMTHTLITEKPWTQDIGHGKPIMTEI